MNDEEVIEILDDFEDTITIPPINKNVVVPNIPPVAPKVETQTPSVNSQTNSNLGVSDVEEIKVEPAVYNEVKNLDNVNYAPIEPEKQNSSTYHKWQGCCLHHFLIVPDKPSKIIK